MNIDRQIVCPGPDNQNGSKLVANRVVGRADAIHLTRNGFLYRIDVQEAIAG